ncbi:heme NO-binding domain-containing protein [Glaciecola petra]|uniref:Heme NO-binding domain-containing protein n=1 Tax=Glaciecola petra TaxID=3075602 RepID=A0ABU2ZS00_9ALTE|nr:heme NO-binding domain-containing protein [Aestuariibacter sp. P117]MDT0595412.1 heme NO-binding domain-containing protein [Aestuariibacter sp. P117]
MKGIVFDEFNNMVEEAFGEDMLDDIIDENASNLATGGAYTSVGTYDHEELVMLVSSLSNATNIAIPDLVKTFGLHLAQVFSTKFSSFFDECTDTFSFLKRIDNHIHVEVYKLYPDAELPKFSFEEPDAQTLNLIYESKRGFADLAEGLIEGTAKYYKENVTIDKEDQSTELMHKVIFRLKK